SGVLTFATTSVATQPAGVTWSAPRLYYDTSCSAQWTALTSTLSVVQGQAVCLALRQTIPAVGATSSTAVVSASLALSNSVPALTQSYSQTDMSTPNAGSGSVVLAKGVRNVTRNVIPWGTDNQAKSGEQLEYQVGFENTSAFSVSNLEVTDNSSSFTTFVRADNDVTPSANLAAGLGVCTLVPPSGVEQSCTGSVSGTGVIKFKFTGVLPPGGKGTVRFTVLVN
ncbi:MAG: hypothetical protein ACR2I0_14450, partial [Rhodoferax sp.]